MFNSAEEWLRYGWEHGYCSPPVCVEHDGVPTSGAEDDELDEFGEFCAYAVRLYESDIQKRQVEKNCPPAIWRAQNRGWRRLSEV